MFMPLFGELERTDDGSEPRIKRAIRRHFEEVAVMDEPHFGGVTDDGRVTFKMHCLNISRQNDIRQVLHRSARQVFFNAILTNLRSDIRHGKYLKTFFLVWLLEHDGRGSAAHRKIFFRELNRIEE